jgi:hypothetical protein
LPHRYEQKRSQGEVWTNQRIVHFHSKCAYTAKQNANERCSILVATGRYRESVYWY